MAGCLGDASEQSVEGLDVVVVQRSAVGTSHLSAAVAVVDRTTVAVTRQFATPPALQSGIAAEQCGEHVVEIDVADDEQRSVPRRSARPTFQLGFTLHIIIIIIISLPSFYSLKMKPTNTAEMEINSRLWPGSRLHHRGRRYSFCI